MTELDFPIAPWRANQADAVPALSVVVPVHNETGNIEPLISEIEAALAGRIDFEIVYVDDSSGDGSATELAGLRGRTRPGSPPSTEMARTIPPTSRR